MDIATTLLHQLGASGANTNYSLGRDLFDTSERPYLVIGDWHSISVRTADIKYRIPYTNRGIDHWQPTTPSDKEYSADEAARVLSENRQMIIDAIKNTSLFSRKAVADKNQLAVIAAQR
jgi:membrane-anchored protein YejM (alkaline phosphatase superfamily)